MKVNEIIENYKAKVLWSDYYKDIKDDFKRFLEKNKEKNIAIWGAGYKTIVLMELVDKEQKYIKKIIDIDKRKRGKKIKGREIICCDDIKNNNFDIVIIINQRHFVQNYEILKENHIQCDVYDMDEIAKRKLNYEQIVNHNDMIQDTKKEEETVKKIQKELLPLLYEIKRLCTKNNIPYFLCAGSALGAVRHKGFIPWDDDLDVGMLRSDYERFMEIADDELSEGFLLIAEERTPDYYVCHSKIFRNHTASVVRANSHLRIHHGFYLDIFPFDVIPENAEQQDEFYWEQKNIRSYYTSMKKRKQYTGRNPIKELIVNNKYYIRNLHSSKKICEKVHNIMSRYNCEDPRYIADLCAPYNKKLFYKYEDIFPTVEMEFEGDTYPVPGNYNTYLKTMYGDYMKLPPKDKRYVKHDIIAMSTTKNYAPDELWLKKYYKKYGRKA